MRRSHVVVLEICGLSHQVFAAVLLHNWSFGQQTTQSHSVSDETKTHTRACTIKPFTKAF